MIKKIFVINLVLGLAFLILGLSIFKTSAQTVSPQIKPTNQDSGSFQKEAFDIATKEAVTATISAQKQTTNDYYLPYPGILPDHPLYFLKMIRDRIWLILTTNPLKKAEVLLLFADKRIGAAAVLVEGNKVNLGLTTATKAEKYLERALEMEKKARDSGKDTRAFLEKLQQATSKHEELLLAMEKKATGEVDLIEKILTYPRQVTEEVSRRLNQ